MDAVAAAGMPAVALTDQSNLFAMVKFYKAAVARGIKPIVGVDGWLAEPGDRAEPSRLILLCQTLEGYRNLTRLVSRSYLEGQRRGVPQFERSWLTPQSVRGLIALSGRPRRRHRSRAHGTPRCRGRLDARRMARAVSGAFLPRARAHRQGGGGRLRSGGVAARGASPRAGRRNQRRAVSAARRFRVARSARVHSWRRAAHRSESPAPLQRRAVPAHPGGNGRALQRRSRGAREFGRDRAALQSRCDAGHAAPA